MEEIDSGVRNVNKYLAIYVNGAIPVFNKENVFTTILPINEGLIKGINDGI